jgi:hypothetical protein
LLELHVCRDFPNHPPCPSLIFTGL